MRKNGVEDRNGQFLFAVLQLPFKARRWAFSVLPPSGFFFRAPVPSRLAFRGICRKMMVHKEYCKAAKDLVSKYYRTPDDKNGPVKSALLSFMPEACKYEGMVFGLCISCFGELSTGFNDVFTFIAYSYAVS